MQTTSKDFDVVTGDSGCQIITLYPPQPPATTELTDGERLAVRVGNIAVAAKRGLFHPDKLRIEMLKAYFKLYRMKHNNRAEYNNFLRKWAIIEVRLLTKG